MGAGGLFLDDLELPRSGSYTIMFAPVGSATGSTTFTLSEAPVTQSFDIAPSPTGASQAISFTAAGERAKLRFSGEEGDTVSVAGAPVALDVAVSVLDANGVPVQAGETFCASVCANFLDAVRLPHAGAYSILVDPQGTATGSLTLTAYDASDLVEQVQPDADGDQQEVTLTTPGRNARLKFEGTGGQRVTVEATEFADGASMSLLRPDGALVGESQSVTEEGGFLEAGALPVTGTYTLLFDPEGTATGSTELTLYQDPADQTKSVTPTVQGDEALLDFDTPGQNAKLTFRGQAGKTVSVVGSSVGLRADVSLIDGEGTRVGPVPTRFCPSGCTDFHDAIQLPANGDYAILVDPVDADVGTMTVTVHDATDVTAAATPSLVGDFKEPVIAAPGQNARHTISGAAGQRIAIYSENFNTGTLKLLRPDGSTLSSQALGPGATLLDTVTLPAAGTYTSVLDPSGPATGTGYMYFYTVQQDQTASVTPSAAGTTTQIDTGPGQNARLNFTGTANQKITVRGTSMSSYLDGRVAVKVIRADGTQVGSATEFCNDGCSNFLDVVTLPAAGSYTVLIDPIGAAAGSMTARVYSVTDATYTVTPTAAGAARSVTTSTPGQTARVTFSGTSGQRIAIRSGNFASGASLRLLKPDGTTLGSPATVGSTGGFLDTQTLPSTGTYTGVFDPDAAATGTAALTFYLVPADQSSAITPSAAGATKAFTFSNVGQNGKATFTGTAGQGISVVKSVSTAVGSTVRVIKADGTPVGTSSTFCTSGCADFLDTQTLPSAGSYAVLVDPEAANTGSITVKVHSVADVTKTITIDGPAVGVTTTVPGQNGRVTFSGNAGTPIRLDLSGVSTASAVSIRKPDGSNLVAPTTIGTSGGTLTATLPTTGTYTIVDDPPGANVGSMTMTLTRPPGAMAPLRAPDVRLAAYAPWPGGIEIVPATLFEAERGHDGAAPQGKRARRRGTERRARPMAAVPSFVRRRQEEWIPSRAERRGNWRTQRPESPWRDVAALRAPAGLTGLAGQVLKLNGVPLAGATVEIEDSGRDARTDRYGRFVVSGMSAGAHVLVVDGGRRYGTYEIRVELERGTTTELDDPIWMSRLDRGGNVKVGPPTDGETVLTNKRIPGLEIRIPAGSVITDRDGQRVRKLNLTAIPVDRLPFPMPAFSEFPLYFTVQPGGAYFSKGARVIYPNYTHEPPGERAAFWQYDPDDRGWRVYGHGTVSADGKQIVPDPGVRIWELTGSSVILNPTVPPTPGTGPGLGDGCCAEPGGPALGGGPGNSLHGDPVDLWTGLFLYQKTDLRVNDVIPADLARVYRPKDNNSYAFGIGANTPYDMRLYHNSPSQWQEIRLVQPDGHQVWYERTSPGTGYVGSVFEAKDAPGRFHHSVLRWVGSWEMTLVDGTKYGFYDNGALRRIRDRNGNELTLERANGRLLKLTTPNGRWIELTYDTQGRITQGRDNGGRTVSYTYDAGGRLETAANVNGGVTTYGYDASGRMTTIEDPRGITYLTNEYNADGMVSKQTMADGGEYTFAYVGNGGSNSQARVTDPRGHVREVNFSEAGYPTSEKLAAGTPLEQEFTFERDPATNVLRSTTDPLDRRTDFGYDPRGNLTSVTELAGTASARTTRITYEPGTSQRTSVTDPLGHRTRFLYDAYNRLTWVRDATGRETTFKYKDGLYPNGTPRPNTRPAAITNSAGETTRYDYTAGDLTAVHDPLGRSVKFTLDPIGRVAAVTDSLGQTTRFDRDPAGNVTRTVAPGGRTTAFEYDGNGNLTGVTDARNNSTSTSYDAMDRVHVATDALGRDETYEYDKTGNLTRHTDRRGKLTLMRYDELNRRTFAGFGATGPVGSEQFVSTIDYQWDLGNRLLQAADSAGGTYTRSFDLFDRLSSETGPNGSIGYTYDAGNRRASMTVSGEAPVTYGYDDANRVTSINKGGASVFLAYDNAGRRSSTTLPNGIVQLYSYDKSSRLLGIDYSRSGSAIGDLHYEYDAAGRRTAMWGTHARTALPDAMGSATYNAANQRVTQDATTLAYDLNGNLTADAAGTFTWNDRDELATVTRGPTTLNFSYDPVGRRKSRTANGTTTGYVHDGPNVVQERQGGAASANLLTGLGVDEIFSRSASGGSSSLLTDGLGSTIALTDLLGLPTTTYTYDPFGKTSAAGAASDNPFQYTGRENDGGGLYHYRARYHSTGMARFISPDPIGLAGGDVNLYTYTGSDPVNHIDPSGLMLSIGGGGGILPPRAEQCNPYYARPGSCAPYPGNSDAHYPVADALARGAGAVGDAAGWILDCAEIGLLSRYSAQSCIDDGQKTRDVLFGCGSGIAVSQVPPVLPPLSPPPVRLVYGGIGCAGGGALGFLGIPVRAAR